MKLNLKIILLLVVLSAALLILVLAICYRHGVFGPHLVLIKTNFARLPGWVQDDHRQAVVALQKSCVVIAKRQPQQPFSQAMVKSGSVTAWHTICGALNGINPDDPQAARQFFEQWFEPYHVYDHGQSQGLFTGYYLPKLRCSLHQQQPYEVPIHALPDDWVQVDLGLFDSKLKGRRIVGQLKDKKLVPYPEKKAIAAGALTTKAKVLAWCDDPVDVAFAQIQGSAVIELPDGSSLLIGYEGANGRPYVALGKILTKSGALAPSQSSMQDIRAWLAAHPEQAAEILNANPSYVFFRILTNNAPLGSQQVPLTPERTLAVDRRYIPLGVPIWLDTTIIDIDSPKAISFQQLLIAQDTGGAIKGVIRGDIYWGYGERAAFIAGKLKSQGQYWVLLPRYPEMAKAAH